MYKYYYLFNESPKVFWTPNSEYKPSAELFATYTDWRQMDKCPINYVDDFRITTILPKNIKTQMLCIEDEEIGFKKYYHLNKINKEMVGGFEYEGTLDVWCTYTLDFIKKLTAPTPNVGKFETSTTHTVYVERFLNNTLYNSEYLSGRAWMKDDPYFDFSNEELWAASMPQNFFAYDNLSYQDPGEGATPNVYINCGHSTWLIKYTSSSEPTITHKIGIYNNVLAGHFANTVYDSDDYINNSNNDKSKHRTYLTNRIILKNISKCRLAVFQEDNGTYTCFILPPKDTQLILWPESGPNKNRKLTSSLTNYRETLNVLLTKFYGRDHVFPNPKGDEWMQGAITEPSYWSNKLVGIFGSPIFIAFLKYSKTLNKTNEMLHGSLYHQEGHYFDGKGELNPWIDKKAWRGVLPYDERKIIKTLSFRIKPDEFRIFARMNEYMRRGWYPYYFRPVNNLLGGKYDDTVRDLNISRYSRDYEYTGSQGGGRKWILGGRNEISKHSSDFNKYLLGRAKFNGVYLNPRSKYDPDNPLEYPPTSGSTRGTQPEFGMFWDSRIAFDGLNWWGVTAKNDPQLWKSPGTMNIATSRYQEFLLQTSANMNTGLQIAAQRSALQESKAIFSGVMGMASGVGNLLSGDVSDGVTGFINSIGNIGFGIRAARMTYSHANAQVQAQLVDKRNSAKPKNIKSNVETDDKEQKLLLEETVRFGTYDDDVDYGTSHIMLNEDTGRFEKTRLYMKYGNRNDNLLTMITKLPFARNDIRFFNNVLWEVGMYGDFYTSPSRAFRKETLKFSYWTDRNPRTNYFIYFKGKVDEWSYKSFEPNLPLTIIEAMKTMFDSGVRIWERVPYDERITGSDYGWDKFYRNNNFYSVVTDLYNSEFYEAPEGGVAILPEKDHDYNEENITLPKEQE